MKITSRPFGETSRGEKVTAYELSNASGARAVVLDYGATIQSLLVPDCTGALVDVVLGYDTAAEYEANNGHLGATIGRVGNRIAHARFSLGGREYVLAANNGEHHLHGGVRGFDKYVWDAEPLSDRLVFSRLSPDGEEGYPGDLAVYVSYELTDANELCITYDADTDAATPVNLTNHAYFNLNGEGGILTHTLTMDSEFFCEADSDCLPTGRLVCVAGTAFDFREGRRLGEALALSDSQTALFGGFDHNFALAGSHAAELASGETGIVMDVYTSMPGVQLYTANGLDSRPGKGGRPMGPHGAVCLETQVYPDAMNHYGFPSPILHPGEHLHTETVYAFSVR